MTGQQGGTPGQPGGASPQDQDSTQVGMPVPPQGPGYVAQPPYGQPPGGPSGPPYGGQTPGYPPPYGQQPGGYLPQPGYPPAQPGYGGPPPGYGPPGYGYAAPPPKRGGPSGVILGLFALLIVLAIGVGVLYLGHLGPFAVAIVTPRPTGTAHASPTPAGTAATSLPTTPPATPTVVPATATPTLGPTALATSTPSIEPPTAPPTEQPSGSSADMQALLNHVPAAFRNTCTPSDTSSTGALVAAVCDAGTNFDFIVTYSQYADAASMQSEYDNDKAAFAADAGSKSCATASNWPSEYEYTINNVSAGRVFCADLFGLPEIYWTDTRFNILTFVFTATATREQEYTFWHDQSGPV